MVEVSANPKVVTNKAFRKTTTKTLEKNHLQTYFRKLVEALDQNEVVVKNSKQAEQVLV